MAAHTVLITGGAGFIGASLALELAGRHPDWELVAFDSLHRRGSELNLPRLRAAGVRFVHGDVREPADLRAAGPFGALVECSAEPSVMAGVGGDTGFLVRTNLLGAYHCLEEAARHRAQVVFLSTSRVYPLAALDALVYEETDTRFALAAQQPLAGACAHGVAEDFPLRGARTLYGASKLAAELLIEEYAESFGLPTVVNRCGVVAGPWQMGKVDQGVFTHWVLAHHFQRPLSYIGYGGHGKQVRDLLHVADLAALVDDQLRAPRALGRRRAQRRRRPRRQPLAARDYRAVPGDHRQRGPDRRRPADAPRGRADLHLRHPRPVPLQRLGAASRSARDPHRDPRLGARARAPARRRARLLSPPAAATQSTQIAARVLAIRRSRHGTALASRGNASTAGAPAVCRTCSGCEGIACAKRRA